MQLEVPSTRVLFNRSTWFIYTNVFIIILLGNLKSWALVQKEFQRYDGWYNNPYHADYGSSESSLIHKARPAFADGLSKMSGANRPPAGLLSYELMKGHDGLPPYQKLTALYAYFGQMVSGEMVSTTSSGNVACPIQKQGVEVYEKVCPMSIHNHPPSSSVPSFKGTNEEFLAEGTSTRKRNCTTLVRSMPFFRAPASNGDYINRPRTPTNFVTTFIDASPVYGPFEPWVDSLRTFAGGRLKADHDLPTRNLVNAPLSNPIVFGEHFDATDYDRTFLLGSFKSNQSPILLAMSIVFHLYHNAIAVGLQQNHPDWSDEQLFQETRRWVIGSMQNIIMYEYFPLVIGESLPVYTGYQPETDPTMTVEFQGAAMRFGHSIVPSTLWIRKRNVKECSSESFIAVALCQIWWNSQEVVQEFNVENVLLGATSQTMERLDHMFSDTLGKKLFGSIRMTKRDLAVVNIMRGRDLGIADYNTVREAYGLERIRKFEDINPELYAEGPGKKTLEKYRKLSNNSLEDLDLFVAGMLESNRAGLGKTFRTIIKEQIIRIRDGDRFWFENTKNNNFNKDEILQLRNVTLAYVIRKALRVGKEIQDDVFNYATAPCPQTFQINSSFHEDICGQPESSDIMDDYSKWSFILIFIGLGIIPFVCIGCGLCFARRQEKQISKIRTRRTIRRGTIRINESFMASEVTSAKSTRNVQIRLDPNVLQLHIMNEYGSKLRLMDLRAIIVIQIFYSDDVTKDLILAVLIPKEYDLILNFREVAERDEFLNNFKLYLEAHEKPFDEMLLPNKDILAQCVTYDTRQELVRKFFRTAFDQVVHHKANLSGTENRMKSTRATEPVAVTRTKEPVVVNMASCAANTNNNNKNAKSQCATMKLLNLQLTKAELAYSLALKPDSIFVEQMFILADTDENGYICYAEFIDLLAMMSKGDMKTKMRMLFDMYDMDKSGELDPNEFQVMVRSLIEVSSSKLKSEELDDLIQTMLGDCGHGQKESLTFEDFFLIIQQHQPKILDDFSYKRSLSTKGKPVSTATRAASSSKLIEISMHTNPTVITKAVTSCSLYKRMYVSYLENNWNHVFFLFMYTGIMVLLFCYMAMIYLFFKEHRGFRAIVGNFAAVSRGAALALCFTMSIVILTVCRNLITYLRDTWLGYYIPFDSAISMHKIAAWSTVVLGVIHTVGHAMNFYQICTQPASVVRCLFPEHFQPTDRTPRFYEWIFASVPGLSGVYLVMAFSIMTVFATQTFRQKLFEAFWRTHRLFVVVIALLFIHGSKGMLQRPILPYFLVGPVVIYILDWVVTLRRISMPMILLKAEVLPSDVLHLSFKLPPGFRYTSGQWFRVSCGSFQFDRNEFHPFTITSAPHEKDLACYIRGVGPWTRKMNRLFSELLADQQKFPTLYVEGPYGSTHQDWFKFPTVVLMGAGIGVTPTASVLKDLVHKVYQQQAEIVCRKVHFIWLARNHTQFEWFIEILREVEELDARNIVNIDIFVTQLLKDYDLRTMMLYICDKHFQRLSNKSLFTGLRAKTHFGRIDFVKYFTGIKQSNATIGKIGIFSCGPKSSVMAVKTAATKINNNGGNPYFIAHHEIF